MNFPNKNQKKVSQKKTTISASLAASIVAEKEASKLQNKITKQRQLEEEKRVQEQFKKITNGDEQTFKCNMCDYKTTSKSCNARREMKVHIERHLNVHISCPFCEKDFVSCRVLKIHKRRDHTSEYQKEKMESDYSILEFIKNNFVSSYSVTLLYHDSISYID